MLPLKYKMKWSEVNSVSHFHAYPLRLRRPKWRRSVPAFCYASIVTSLPVSFRGITQLSHCQQSIHGEYGWTNCLVLSDNAVVKEQITKDWLYVSGHIALSIFENNIWLHAWLRLIFLVTWWTAKAFIFMIPFSNIRTQVTMNWYT